MQLLWFLMGFKELCVLTAALLVLLTGSAGTGIVSAGFLFLNNGLGTLVGLNDFQSLFFGGWNEPKPPPKLPPGAPNALRIPENVDALCTLRRASMPP